MIIEFIRKKSFAFFFYDFYKWWKSKSDIVTVINRGFQLKFQCDCSAVIWLGRKSQTRINKPKEMLFLLLVGVFISCQMIYLIDQTFYFQLILRKK